ncbi:urease accessory protein UreF [Rhizobium alvei]|uniref:Urease accessory protein UreF n=1 Tax=Rhizobium alvei TaxID=1132659 RepID=A0ABT8YMQ9_9HYPH|nr:urease accessory protein UreF [Rhizobium alvei]MDO6964537.1 urease accessory protein UreF [Rhizobium alvei]
MGTVTTMGTGMATDRSGLALLRLQSWLSPAFPVGGFAYSSALEAATHHGIVRNAESLGEWLAALLEKGAFWNDIVLLAEAWNSTSDPERLRTTTELALALAGSSERLAEISQLGGAFVAAARSWPHPLLDSLGSDTPYCIAVGAVAGAHEIPLFQTLVAYLHAVVSQQISAAIRLSVIGQIQGVKLLSDSENMILDLATRGSEASLDDLGSQTIIADIMAMQHEVQHSRLFRS